MAVKSQERSISNVNTDVELIQVLIKDPDQCVDLNSAETNKTDSYNAKLAKSSKKSTTSQKETDLPAVPSNPKIEVTSQLESREEEEEDTSGNERTHPISISPAVETTESTLKTPDGGWGWLVVFGAFLVSFLMTGLLKSFGILYVEILENFPDATPENVAWIPGILNTLSLVLSPLSNALRTRYGCRCVVFVGGVVSSTGMLLSSFAPNVKFLALTSGGIAGIGATLALTPSIIIVGQYFDKKRAMANSLSLCGSGLGGLILPLFLNWALNEFTLRGTYLLLAGLLLNICVSAMLYIPLDAYWKTRRGERASNDNLDALQTSSQNPVSVQCVEEAISTSQPAQFDGHIKQTCMYKLRKKLHLLNCKIISAFSLELLTDRVFLIIATSVVFMSMGAPHVLFFLPSHAETEFGLSKYVAALLLSISSAGDLSGRAFLGYVSDKKYFQRHHEYMVAILTSGAATLCIAFTSFYPLLAFCCFVYGVGIGTWQCFVPVLLADCLGTEKLGGTLALSRMFQGFSNLLVPIFVGRILELTDHYSYVFLWMACSMTMAGLVVILLPRELKKLKQDSLSIATSSTNVQNSETNPK